MYKVRIGDLGLLLRNIGIDFQNVELEEVQFVISVIPILSDIKVGQVDLIIEEYTSVNNVEVIYTDDMIKFCMYYKILADVVLPKI